MLYNKPGIKEAVKLRSILLVEACFDFFNKLLIGVHIMISSEKSGVISIDQCVWRKVRSVI